MTMLMLYQRKRIKGKIGAFPEINLNGKNLKKGKEISAVSKKELKKIKENSPDRRSTSFTKISFSKRAYVCTFTHKVGWLDLCKDSDKFVN